MCSLVIGCIRARGLDKGFWEGHVELLEVRGQGLLPVCKISHHNRWLAKQMALED